jgi:hypothetical protein
MISHSEVEKNSYVSTTTELVKTGSGEISSLTLTGGTAATGSSVNIINSLTSTGTSLWYLQAPQYGSSSISFVKPIPASNGIFVVFNSGTAAKLSIAYT